MAQTEFDRQAEVTRLLLEGISSTHVSLPSTPNPLPSGPATKHRDVGSSQPLGASSPQVNHLRCLHEFVKSQTTYYAQCYRHMLDLQKQLGRCGQDPGPQGASGQGGWLCGGAQGRGGAISPLPTLLLLLLPVPRAPCKYLGRRWVWGTPRDLA